MSREAVIGWDLGGAHLKAARLEGGRLTGLVQLACPLWRGLDRLEAAMEEALTALAAGGERHAVTMTGELVDLFPDRRRGVAALSGAMAERLGSRRVAVYAGGEGFIPPAEAGARAGAVASANWLASAEFVARRLPQALFVDMGSTTTDIVPLADGRPRPCGHDDAGRMAAEELVYTGVVRTPVMRMAPRLPFAGQWLEPMAEHFATAADVYRILGRLPEHADLGESADGGPKDPAASTRRLARMVGRDAAEAPSPAWQALAAFLAEAQRRRLADACALVASRGAPAPDAPLVGAGVGRFVLRELAAALRRPYVDFTELLPRAGQSPLYGDGGDCAPAAAVAALLQEVA